MSHGRTFGVPAAALTAASARSEEGGDPIGHDVGVRIAHEVAGAGHQLEAQVVAAALETAASRGVTAMSFSPIMRRSGTGVRGSSGRCFTASRTVRR